MKNILVPLSIDLSKEIKGSWLGKGLNSFRTINEQNVSKLSS